MGGRIYSFLCQSQPRKEAERSQVFMVQLSWPQHSLEMLSGTSEWRTGHGILPQPSDFSVIVMLRQAWSGQRRSQPQQSPSSGKLQGQPGLYCLSCASWVDLMLPEQSQLQGGWPWWWKPFLQRTAELRLPLNSLYSQTPPESGTNQCCMSAPMQTLLHNFQLTGEIKIIPDINQLHSASGHNLNTFSRVFFPLYKSSKFTFYPSHCNYRKHLMRDSASVSDTNNISWGHSGRKWKGILEKLLSISFPKMVGPKCCLKLWIELDKNFELF